MQSFPYSELSTIVGVVQAADAVLLYKARGVINKWLVVFSFFEYLWAGISFSALSSGAPRWLPMSFVIYIVAGLAYGIFLNSHHSSSGAAAKAVPMWFVIFGGFFGLYFVAASFYVSVLA